MARGPVLTTEQFFTEHLFIEIYFTSYGPDLRQRTLGGLVVQYAHCRRDVDATGVDCFGDLPVQRGSEQNCLGHKFSSLPTACPRSCTSVELWGAPARGHRMAILWQCDRIER